MNGGMGPRKFVRPDVTTTESVIAVTIECEFSGGIVQRIEDNARARRQTPDSLLTSLLIEAVERLPIRPAALQPVHLGKIEVPSWVPAQLRSTYLMMAERQSEEAAAAWARKAKRGVFK